MEFAKLLKTSRESAGLTQEQAAAKLNVTEKTISNWETATTIPPADKCQAIGKVYGIERDILLRSYEDAVWPPEQMPEDFPTCLFVDAVLPYVTNLNFSPLEVELIRMLEIYHSGSWTFSSLSEAYDLLRKLPYSYISRIGVSVLPQMMMDISKKLWPTVNPKGYHNLYDNTFQWVVTDSIMLTQNGEPLSSFSVFHLPLDDILWIAKRVCIKDSDGNRYYVVTDNHTVEAIRMISQGKDQVCVAQTRLNNNGTDYSMDSEWKDLLHIDSYYSFHPEDNIEKNASPWVQYEWKCKDSQSICSAVPTKKGEELLRFYQKHTDLFDK